MVDQAVLKLECIKEAREEICGATEPLGGIVDEANCLINALNLIKEVDSFQTREIGREARGIVELSALLIASMLVMSAESRHRIQPRELQPQDHEYHHLEAMLGQLREARKTLESSMTAAYVGLQGNSQDGFQVSRKRLVDANEKIKKVFGVDTLVYIRLQDQLSAQAGKQTLSYLNGNFQLTGDQPTSSSSMMPMPTDSDYPRYPATESKSGVPPWASRHGNVL